MRDNYDFSKGIKNPYIEKMKEGYTVTVHYDFTDCDVAETDDIETAITNRRSGNSNVRQTSTHSAPMSTPAGNEV